MASTEEMGIEGTRRNSKPRPLADEERKKLNEYIDSDASVAPLPQRLTTALQIDLRPTAAAEDGI